MLSLEVPAEFDDQDMGHKAVCTLLSSSIFCALISLSRSSLPLSLDSFDRCNQLIIFGCVDICNVHHGYIFFEYEMDLSVEGRLEAMRAKRRSWQ